MIEFIILYCVICAIGVLLVGIGFGTSLFVKGVVSLIGAIGIGIARLLEFLQNTILRATGCATAVKISSEREGTLDLTDRKTASVAFIIAFIALTAWLANVT